jgi:hypothetical protein
LTQACDDLARLKRKEIQMKNSQAVHPQQDQVMYTNRASVCFAAWCFAVTLNLSLRQSAHSQQYTVIDLGPDGYDSSGAAAVSNGQQVGVGAINGHNHALVWSGSSDTVVDLNPPGTIESVAVGTSGTQQFGHGYDPANGDYHALLWSGSADSVVDLHPDPDFVYTKAFGMSADQQVGFGYSRTRGTQALLWSGTPDSVI